jgi:CRISPR/Cas system-associated exonuclease Cas4 (RecB family)
MEELMSQILTPTSNKDIKEPNKFRFSRLSCFQKCPRKHFYEYEEMITPPENKHLFLGKSFHAALESIHKNGNCDDIFTEFRNACISGDQPFEPDLLEYMVVLYMQYYNDISVNEEVIACEYNFSETLDNGIDYMTGTIDWLILDKVSGEYIIRDVKTTDGNLKYTFEDVQHNAQLLFYVPYIEQEFGVTVSVIQIDEVRCAKLCPPPINNDGTPTVDKRRLSLTTAQMYADVLGELGLLGDAKYQGTLDYLEQRGHPLFNRVSYQILDPELVSTNIEDMYDTYLAIKKEPNSHRYRVKSPLCNYCAFKSLCDLDRSNPTTAERQILINKIQENS